MKRVSTLLMAYNGHQERVYSLGGGYQPLREGVLSQWPIWAIERMENVLSRWPTLAMGRV
jgi:hypothetical protein